MWLAVNRSEIRDPTIRMPAPKLRRISEAGFAFFSLGIIPSAWSSWKVHLAGSQRDPFSSTRDRSPSHARTRPDQSLHHTVPPDRPAYPMRSSCPTDSQLSFKRPDDPRGRDRICWYGRWWPNATFAHLAASYGRANVTSPISKLRRRSHLTSAHSADQMLSG